MNRIPSHPTVANQRLTPHSGVTLVEVLVSMVIMSVGIVLLATLLPISILRTAQATQLTQAVFLKNNAQALIDSNPWFLDNTNLSILGTNTSNNITYAVIDPLGYYVIGSPAGVGTATGRLLGGITTRPRIAGGAASVIQAGALAQLPDSWTEVVTGPASVSATPPYAVPPYIQIAATVPVPTLSVFNAYTSSSAYTVAAQQAMSHYRMVLYDISGNAVIKPVLQQPSSQHLYWWDLDSSSGSPLTYGSSLPTGFTPVRARVEVMQRRFTWMMTVKKDQLNPVDVTWSAEVDVAVFFNRGFTANDETLYTVTPGLANAPVVLYGIDAAPGVINVDDDNNGIVDWTNSPTNTVPDPGEISWSGSDDSRTVIVTWTGTPPYLKKGGFMLEPTNLEWYRIVDVQLGALTATLLLDRDLRYTNATPITSGLFMKGIVDVYPLATAYGQN